MTMDESTCRNSIEPMTVQHEQGYNGIPNKSGINDCHWNYSGTCTSWECTQSKPVAGHSRNWDSRQNCTLTQLGAPICSAYLQEGSVGIRSRSTPSPKELQDVFVEGMKEGLRIATETPPAFQREHDANIREDVLDKMVSGLRSQIIFTDGVTTELYRRIIVDVEYIAETIRRQEAQR